MERCSSQVRLITHFHKSLIDVAVSASEEIQDDLRRLVRGYLDERVSLLELEYQP